MFFFIIQLVNMRCFDSAPYGRAPDEEKINM